MAIAQYRYSNVPKEGYNNIELTNNKAIILASNGGILNANTYQITKLGVQTEPGVQLQINGNNIIVVGRSGIYELDNPNVVIKSLTIIPRPNYVKDDEETKKAQKQAVEYFNAVKKNSENLNVLTTNEDGGWANETSVEEWIAAYKTTDNTETTEIEGILGNYLEGYQNYLKGKFGVYKEKAGTTFADLIVDVVYENTQQ